MVNLLKKKSTIIFLPIIIVFIFGCILYYSSLGGKTENYDLSYDGKIFFMYEERIYNPGMKLYRPYQYAPLRWQAFEMSLDEKIKVLKSWKESCERAIKRMEEFNLSEDEIVLTRRIELKVKNQNNKDFKFDSLVSIYPGSIVKIIESLNGALLVKYIPPTEESNFFVETIFGKNPKDIYSKEDFEKLSNKGLMFSISEMKFFEFRNIYISYKYEPQLALKLIEKSLLNHQEEQELVKQRKEEERLTQEEKKKKLLAIENTL